MAKSFHYKWVYISNSVYLNHSLDQIEVTFLDTGKLILSVHQNKEIFFIFLTFEVSLTWQPIVFNQKL